MTNRDVKPGPLSADGPETIWLEPSCCADALDGRTWCEDNAFPVCEDGREPVKYVRADIAFRLVEAPADKGSLQPSASVPTEGHGTGVVGWQPIETAPRDGTRVIGFTKFGVEVVKWHEWDGAEYGPRTGWIGVEQDSTCYPESYLRAVATYQPTHWMPLPPPPAASVSMGTSRKASEPIQAVNAELLEAAVEFVRKVDAGEARSTKSYAAFKAAIAKATALEGGQ